MKNNQLVCIRHNNGKVSRIPQEAADRTVFGGEAKFISNTLFKAAKAGIVVKKGMSDSDIMTRVREARTPKKVKKVEKEEKAEKERQPRQRRGKKREEK